MINELVKLRNKIAELEKEIGEYQSGHKGACSTCEPVGELNQKLEQDLMTALNALDYYANKMGIGGTAMRDLVLIKKLVKDFENNTTITVGYQDNPVASIAKGHIGGIAFDKAWKKEGWDGAFDEELTDEALEQFNKGLQHCYGCFTQKGFRWNLEATDEKAIPVTVMLW